MNRTGEAVQGTERELGLLVAGGKGKASRKTPQELANFGTRYGIDAETLIRASRLSAKVDNNAVQDGYQLYHHTFFLTIAGRWAVVQQGMRETDHTARRYHWLSDRIDSFVQEPHAAVCCDQRVETLNLVASESERAPREMTLLPPRDPSSGPRSDAALPDLPSYLRSPGDDV